MFFLALLWLDENEHAESSGRGKTAFKSHSQVFCWFVVGKETNTLICVLLAPAVARLFLSCNLNSGFATILFYLTVQHKMNEIVHVVSWCSKVVISLIKIRLLPKGPWVFIEMKLPKEHSSVQEKEVPWWIQYDVWMFVRFSKHTLMAKEVSPGMSAWFSLEGQNLYYRHSEN